MGYLEFKLSDEFEFNVNEGEFVTFMGEGNSLIIDSLLFKFKKCNIKIENIELNSKNLFKIRKRIGFVLNKDIDIFVGETVKDEIAFGLENLALKPSLIMNIIELRSKQFGIEELLKREPNSLGSCDKVKMKMASVIAPKPRIIVLDNVISELDLYEYKRVVKILKDFVKKGGIVLNFTSNVEEAMLSSRLVISNKEKIIVDDKLMKVLDEEKLLKRIGIGLPFIVEFNKYLMDYKVIKNYNLNMKNLVEEIWK